MEVTLSQMLLARERRAALQQELLLTYGRPVLCLGMNIPGPVKNTPLVRLLFRQGVTAVRALGYPLLCERVRSEVTGCEAVFAVDAPEEELKAACEQLEEAFPAARLFDLDVIGTDGAKLSRATPRACLLCGGPASVCARSRAHGLEALTERVEKLLKDYAADTLSAMAVDALRREAETTPKPGLVDGRNSGAHQDMDLAMFLRSAEALGPYFRQAAMLGMAGAFMEELRRAGLAAEQAMYAATGGVNTHKGAVYSLGLLVYGCGRSLMVGGEPTDHAAALAAGDAVAALQRASRCPDTHGDTAFQVYGASGARGEAAAGFPNALYALERLRAYRSDRPPANAEALTLLDLLARVTDTNLIYRGGLMGLKLAQGEAARILALPREEQLPALYALDDLLIEKHLSPGGCADLLALGLFLEQALPLITDGEE